MRSLVIAGTEAQVERLSIGLVQDDGDVNVYVNDYLAGCFELDGEGKVQFVPLEVQENESHILASNPVTGYLNIA